MIDLVTSVDDALVAAFARLQPQLSKAAPPDRAALEAIVEQPGTRLLVYRSGEEILGTLTLTLYRIPTGLQARIDDVVVDAAARGQGAGEGVSRQAIELARAPGAKKVKLT
jgi:ribosomal protein S18 acetylase RimI-like enzyme